MRSLLLALLALSIASFANAAAVSISWSPTPGQLGADGFYTGTLSFETTGSESFRGVDATFTGAMNQVNPAGSPTIFTDSNAFFPFVGAEVAQDSQFLFQSGTVLSIGSQEGPNILKAAISGLSDNGLPNPAPFAQIVTKSQVQVQLAFDTGIGTPVAFSGIIEPPAVPEPTCCVLAGLALAGFAARRRV